MSRPLSLSRFEDLFILNISSSGEVMFQFFGDRHDAGKVRDMVSRMEERERLGEISLSSDPPTLHHEQGLQLVGISMNSRDTTREGDQVILSCVAQGSDQLTFNWYKDGYTIDVTKTSGIIWKKYLPKNSKDEYTSILVIESVQSVDQGQYTCQIVDWGTQECKSIYLDVQGVPKVQVSPITISVKKGENINLECVSPNQRVWYSWTRDNTLFPMVPGVEVWEDLKPWGSILRVYNIQKSTTYTCHAHTSLSTKETNIRIDMFTQITCNNDNSSGLFWRSTAAGATATANCPTSENNTIFVVNSLVPTTEDIITLNVNSYVGTSTRYCLTIKSGQAVWEEPDLSNCISEKLGKIIEDFRLISRGYIKASLLALLSDLYSWSSTKKYFLRGEGEPILNLLGEVLDFVNRTFTAEEMLNVTKVFYANIDILLSKPESIIHREKVGLLQMVVEKWTLLWTKRMNSSFEHLSYDLFVVDAMKLKIKDQDRYYVPPGSSSRYPRWYSAQIAIDFMGHPTSQTSNVAIINYQNISVFLPKTSTQMLSDGTELSYELHSNIISISTLGGMNLRLDMTIPVKEVRSGWNLTCGRTDVLGSEWDFSSCHHVVRSGNVTQCRCHKTGVYAALMTKYSLTEGREISSGVPTSSLVALSCSSCLIQSLLTLLLLLSRWWTHRTCTLFFKIQSCFAVSFVMSIFLYASKLPPPQDFFQLMTVILELFFFLGLSSHLGKLLIIYAEVVYIPNIKSAKNTIFGLMAGTTLLTCLISLLAERLSGRESTSWWLPLLSPSFYTAGVSTSLILCLYLLLITSLIRRLTYLRRLKDPKSNFIITGRILAKIISMMYEIVEPLRKYIQLICLGNILSWVCVTPTLRIALLKRTTILFGTLLSVAISSVIFVNSPNKHSTYIFCSLSALLGFLMFFCYIVHSESTFKIKLIKRLKVNGKESEFSSDADYNLFSFYTKQAPEVESEGVPPAINTGETSIPLKEISESNLQKQEHYRYDIELPPYFQQLNDTELEVYPRTQPSESAKKTVVFDIAGSQNLVTTLDIVQDIGETTLSNPVQEVTNTSVESPSEVLDKISHDLDYLLNRTPTASVKNTPEKTSKKQATQTERCEPPYVGKTVF